MRIQVRLSESILTGRDNHEPRTGVISSFKRVSGYPDKNKKKYISFLKTVRSVNNNTNLSTFVKKTNYGYLLNFHSSFYLYKTRRIQEEIVAFTTAAPKIIQ
jgi:hypothetical protein